ncbi:MAG: hypothetical protein GON13_01190 [Nanoarchaeota archaeon]|nr:hypothetical protein [Nanoarchaeota archaeon]
MKSLDKLMLELYVIKSDRVLHYKTVPKLVKFVVGMISEELDVSKLFFAAKYHDIGRLWYSKGRNAFFHQYATFLILKKHGFEKEGDIAMRHDCFGWTPEETRRVGFNKEFKTSNPIDLIPNSVESKILALVDSLRGWDNKHEDLWNPKKLHPTTKKFYASIGSPDFFLSRKKRMVTELEKLGLNTQKVIEKAKKLYSVS